MACAVCVFASIINSRSCFSGQEPRRNIFLAISISLNPTSTHVEDITCDPMDRRLVLIRPSHRGAALARQVVGAMKRRQHLAALV